MKNVQDLDVWKNSQALVLSIYKIIEAYPKVEEYALKDQLRRAVCSVPTNIAEGYERHYYKDKVHFFYIARGSLEEVKSLVITSLGLKYIEQIQYNQIFDEIIVCHKLLNGLIRKTKQYYSNI